MYSSVRQAPSRDVAVGGADAGDVQRVSENASPLCREGAWLVRGRLVAAMTPYADTASTYVPIYDGGSTCCHVHVSPRPLPLPEWAKLLKRIDHLLPRKATNMAILDGRIIAWTNGPSWRITEYLRREGIKTFSGLVQRRAGRGDPPWPPRV